MSDLLERVEIIFLLDLESVNSLISDTFTLIAGFVAIGIPLSLQVVQQIAQKYKSPYLISHISSVCILSPSRLIFLAIFYFFPSLIFKYLIESDFHCGDKYLLMNLFAWVLVGIFSLLFILVAIWYRRLFKYIQMDPKELFDDLSK